MGKRNLPHFAPALFASEPSRDDRFQVVKQWAECAQMPADGPEKSVEFLHRQMNEEINSLECCARNLADFPDAPWELRMSIAKQAYDEARHIVAFRNLYEARGGRVGQYPVMNFQYCIITNVDTIEGRLSVQNRSFEAEGVDAIESAITEAKSIGDLELAELFEAQLADEIGHVRFANDYIGEAVRRVPSIVMKIGRALNYSSQAFLQVMGQDAIDSVDYGVNSEGRLEAGFSAEEVEFTRADKADRKRSPGI